VPSAHGSFIPGIRKQPDTEAPEHHNKLDSLWDEREVNRVPSGKNHYLNNLQPDDLIVIRLKYLQPRRTLGDWFAVEIPFCPNAQTSIGSATASDRGSSWSDYPVGTGNNGPTGNVHPESSV
jgi:hypothetical protein